VAVNYFLSSDEIYYAPNLVPVFTDAKEKNKIIAYTSLSVYRPFLINFETLDGYS
jgi:hypothetical protein